MKTNISYRIKRSRAANFSKSIQPVLKNKFGIWIDGKTYWIHNGTEKLIPDEAISIKINKVSIHSKIGFFDIYVTNHSESEKEIKLIVTHSFEKFHKDDLTFFSPSEKVIYHLTNRAFYLVNGQINGSLFSDYTMQPVWNIYTDQFWDCQNKGTLKYQPMSKGPSNSLFVFEMKIPGLKTHKANTWMISGNTRSELLGLNQVVLKNTLDFQSKK